MLLSVVLLSACSLGGDISNVSIDRGISKLYSRKDIDSAIELILEQFKEFDGCTLHTIKYAGDEESMANLDYCNSLNEEADYIQSIYFISSFHTPKYSDDGWNPDEEYEYGWYLAREKDGVWHLVTYGMG